MRAMVLGYLQETQQLEPGRQASRSD